MIIIIIKYYIIIYQAFTYLLIVYSAWISPGQNTGVGSYSLLQGNFPTQGSNPGLLPYAGGLFTV